MRTISFITVFGFVLGSALFASNANAQHIVKRVKCADHTSSSEQLRVYRNTAGITRIVSFQVVRDGCRPKSEEGRYWLNVDSTNPSSRVPIRHGKFTEVLDVPVAHNGLVHLYFAPATVGDRVSGTFDYTLTAD